MREYDYTPDLDEMDGAGFERRERRLEQINASAYDLPGMPDRYYGSQYSIGGYDLLNGQRFLALAIINGEEVWKEMKFFGYERGEHVAGVECDGVEWEPDMINVSGYPEINGQPGMLLPDNADNEEEV